MFKKYFFFVIFGFSIFLVFPQEPISIQENSYIYAQLRDTNKVKRNEKGLIPLDKSVVDIFTQFSVTSFQYAFPKIKTDYLKQTVAIECKCNAEELISSLKDKTPDFFYDIYHSKTDDIPMYEPSDDMWYNHYSDDGRSWLWHLHKIQADKAWDITKGSSSINIAIFDNGFDITHPDLANKINPPYNPHTGNLFGYPNESHGTICASAAAAETDGGGGLASIGFNTNLIAYDKSSSSVENLLYHAVYEMNADIITYSFFGQSSVSTTMRLLIKDVLDKGTVIVRAAGNRQADSDNGAFPFAHQVDERVIIVGATDKNDNHTTPYPGGETYANYPEIDICAPGYEIMVAHRYDNGVTSTWPYYGFQGGTSVSTPIVAGVCALIKSINKCLSVADIQYIIKATADPIRDAHLYPGTVGAGRINAYKAVLMARDYGEAGSIATNTTWSNEKYVKGTITIKNNATLTIKKRTTFASSAKIIVERGGRLIIDGGILTNACEGELWQGIYVKGTSSIRQEYTQHHGVVEIKNNGRVENAVCGIYVGYRTASGLKRYSGGIVYAQNAQFINNKRAIYFEPYTGELNVHGQMVDNKSYFKNCEFILDDNALFDDPGIAFVELQGVKGVFFQNSTFADNRSSKNKLTNGIYANDASMYVGSSYWSSGTIFGGGMGYDGCDFSGFDKAIYIQSASTRPSRVYFSKFSGNGIGVDCYGSNGLLVEGCEFHIPNYIYSNTQRLHGIWIEESSGFTIENNYFTGGSGTGIHFKENGFGNHFVKGNTFNHLCRGCSVEGKNGEELPKTEAQGLVFQCNSFNNNDVDISIYKDSWMRHTQSGDNDRATGNVFSNSNYNIYSSSDVFFHYHFYEPDVSHHVNNLYSSHNSVELKSRNSVSCLYYGYSGERYYTTARLEPHVLDESYTHVLSVYEHGIMISDENGFGNNPIDWGNPEVGEILERLRDYDFDRYVYIGENGEIEVRNIEIEFPESEELSQQVFLCVHLTNLRQIMDKICYNALELLASPIEDDSNPEENNLEQYRTWISRLNTIESKYLLAESYMETGEFDMKDAKMEEIQISLISADGTPVYGEESFGIFENYRRYFQVSQEYYQLALEHGDSDFEIPSHIIEQFRDLSNFDNIVGIKSASFLEKYSIEAIDYRIPDVRDYHIHPACIAMVIGLHKNASEDSPLYEEPEDLTNKDNIEVNVHPNPTNNTIFISLDKMSETSIHYQIYDIQGKELQSGNFSNQKQELDISSLSKGLYFISVTVENQSKITKKIVKE